MTLQRRAGRRIASLLTKVRRRFIVAALISVDSNAFVQIPMTVSKFIITSYDQLRRASLLERPVILPAGINIARVTLRCYTCHALISTFTNQRLELC